MTEDIESTYNKIMDSYNYTNVDNCEDVIDGYYHQLSAPGYNEMGSADIIAQTV